MAPAGGRLACMAPACIAACLTSVHSKSVRSACRITPWTAPPPSPPGTAPLPRARAPGPGRGHVQCRNVGCKRHAAGERQRHAMLALLDTRRSCRGRAPFRQTARPSGSAQHPLRKTLLAAGRPQRGRTTRNGGLRQQRWVTTTSRNQNPSSHPVRPHLFRPHSGLKWMVRQIFPPRYIFAVLPSSSGISISGAVAGYVAGMSNCRPGGQCRRQYFKAVPPAGQPQSACPEPGC